MFEYEILVSRFLLWRLYLLICIRIVSVTPTGGSSVNDLHATIDDASRSPRAAVALHGKTSLIPLFAAALMFPCKNGTPAVPSRKIPVCGHCSPGTADWLWGSAAPGERGPRYKVTVWEELIRRLPALTREVTNIRNTRSTDSRTSLNLRFTFHLIGVSMTTCARPDGKSSVILLWQLLKIRTEAVTQKSRRERESATAQSLSCSHTLIKSYGNIQWMDRWMDGAPLSLLFPSVLSFLQCAAVMPPSLKLRWAKVGKNFIHTDCHSCSERPIGDQHRQCAASDWLVLWVGGTFTVMDLIFSLSFLSARIESIAVCLLVVFDSSNLMGVASEKL